MKTILLLFVSTFTFAQGFMPGFDTFSGKKPSYITLKDGTQLEGSIDDLDRKKGLIEEITLKIDKKSRKIEPSEIKEMYLPASGWSKLGNTIDVTTKVDKWENSKINTETINKGYGFLENSMVILKGKEQELLMQIVNPAFANRIRVYFDPWARETMSVGIGGLTLAGGIDKSYYVKVGNKPAFKIEKKNYKESIDLMYGTCPSLVKKLKEDYKWEDFAKHVYEHSNCK
jgi:hypothetical protein